MLEEKVFGKKENLQIALRFVTVVFIPFLIVRSVYILSQLSTDSARKIVYVVMLYTHILIRILTLLKSFMERPACSNRKSRRAVLHQLHITF